MGTQIYYCLSDTVQISETSYHVHLFYNEKQATDEHQRCLTFQLTVEEEDGWTVERRRDEIRQATERH